MHMWRAGKRMKREIEGRLEKSSVKLGRAAFMGVFAFTLLMITREGMETALLMTQLIFTVKSTGRRWRRRRHMVARVCRPGSGRVTATASTCRGSSR
jgi:high-affinity Fe2+/Pb2+ permease